ncbi:flagellin [Cohaesibacter haloalkalitolerans]|uniref:flagellin n=1 Tax=Cohaesibacter haloalkalitolerans TaxID=1162980 RepID=UPI0013C4C25D|nr:flagellin [Cohaesibacter haloalkalitolerans]
MRVATFQTTSSLLQKTMTTQAKLAEVQAQQSSGLKSTDYGGLGASAGKVVDLNVSVSRAEANISAAKTVISRSDMAASVLQDITDILTNARSAVSGTSSSDQLDTLKQNAAEYLEDLKLMVNTQYQGRYLFSGSMTDTAPVDLSAYSATDLTTVNTDYYQGDSYIQSIRLDNGQQMNYGTTATIDGIEQAFRALSYVANGNLTDTSELADVDALLVGAQDGIIAATSKAGSTSSRLQSYIQNEEDFIAEAKEMAKDETSIDVAEAAILATSYETQLEASFSALSKIINLKLVDYL